MTKEDGMSIFAIWRRLDTPGHDAALLIEGATGWSLSGTAVFRHEDGPASVHYTIELDPGWRTRRGTVRGFVADRVFDHMISREHDGWHLDGRHVGLGHLVDLDLAFTPATNLQHLRRVAPAVGTTVDIPVAWFDIGFTTLVELPQRYERRDQTTYGYVAPSVPFEGTLVFAENGFARRYADVWAMED
jgi:hypothetical protein